MTAKRQEATKLIYNHDEAITNLNSYYLLNTVYSSLEEVFEFCWGSFANEHNTLLKLTRRNVKLKKFAFSTPWLPDLLCKYWFTSSVWNFYRWVADVPPHETSQAARSKEKQLFLQARPLIWGKILGFWRMRLMKCAFYNHYSDNNKNFYWWYQFVFFQIFCDFFKWVNLSQILA